MHKLVLLRHGESDWNKENRFTGWTDVDLSEKGRQEAQEAGAALEGRRATPSTWPTRRCSSAPSARSGSTLDELDLMWIPVDRSWRLNERHYGALQGLNKAGDGRQVRRGAGEDLAPQLRHPAAGARRRTTSATPAATRATRISRPQELPLTECLKDTVARFLPYWHDDHRARPSRRAGACSSRRTATACARWSSTSTTFPKRTIVDLNIPTGMPLVYELDDDLKPQRSYYLGDPEKVKAAMDAVAAQGKKR